MEVEAVMVTVMATEINMVMAVNIFCNTNGSQYLFLIHISFGIVSVSNLWIIAATCFCVNLIPTSCIFRRDTFPYRKTDCRIYEIK